MLKNTLRVLSFSLNMVGLVTVRVHTLEMCVMADEVIM